jgi:hypothetical protein
MNNRELFKEAIADAKAVKEAAIANAKAALEESFAPYLKERLTKKLEEMENDDDEVTFEETSNDITEMTDEDINDIAEMYGDDEDITEMYGDDEDITEMYGDDEDITEMYDEENVELDELLAELGLDEMEETENVEEDLFEAKDESDEDDEDISLEDMSEDQLVKFIEDVIKDMIESGELEAGEGSEETETETETDVEDEEDVSIDELLFELKKKKAEKAKKDEDEKVKAKKDEELKEAVKTINALRAELNEVNLLNAKLLYTNKIFKAKNLSESQKVKVLSTFDKATTVKEVKLVFESLSESISTAKKETIKESLGFASKATGVSNNNSTQKIVEEDAMVARFKKLAGLI